jgi:hypothetical protein
VVLREEVVEERKRWWAKYFPTDSSAKPAEGSTSEFAGGSHVPCSFTHRLRRGKASQVKKLGIVDGVGKEFLA